VSLWKAASYAISTRLSFLTIRGLRFTTADDSLDHRSHHVHLPTVEVQIPPSEPKQLALPKAGRRVHKDQDAGQWTPSAKKLPDFIDKKDERYPAMKANIASTANGKK
jgi:hypothetical protein